MTHIFGKRPTQAIHARKAKLSAEQRIEQLEQAYTALAQAGYNDHLRIYKLECQIAALRGEPAPADPDVAPEPNATAPTTPN